MNKRIIIGALIFMCGTTANIRIVKQQIELMQAEQAVLRSMFTTKVDRLNHVTGRHEYAETLREELERFEHEGGVK